MLDRTIKCVIWDLDETLWDGTLAEGDDVSVRPELARLVEELDSRGIVNALCSKNDYGEARRKLEDLGLWDYFVFPVVEFAPKGPSVKAMLEAMQLRPANALLLDDNPGNRNEVLYYCPEIGVADVNDPECLPALRDVLARTSGRSRRDQYRMLEQKHHAKKAYGDNKAFLEDSDITVCILRNPADLIFKERIVELVNRSNQLNFTNSRFSPAEFEDYVGGPESIHVHHGSILVYDRFGDYGMVGFYAFDERPVKRHLDHFVFSCRVMNMGVEQAVYRHLRSAHGLKRFAPLEHRAGEDASLRLIHSLDRHLEEYVVEKMDLPEEYSVSIVAGCTSGIIEHYLDESLKPARFDNYSLVEGGRIESVEAIVFAVYAEYPEGRWRDAGGFTPVRFADYLRRFLEQHRDRRVFLLAASEKYGGRRRGDRPGGKVATLLRPAVALYRLTGLRQVRFSHIRLCNALVRECAAGYPNVTVVEAGDHVRDRDEQIDPRHFDRVVIRRLAETISSSLRTDPVPAASQSVGFGSTFSPTSV